MNISFDVKTFLIKTAKFPALLIKTIIKIIKNLYIGAQKNPVHALLVGAFAVQCMIWTVWTSKIRYDFTITPLPPSKLEMKVFSLGDEELLYRFYGDKLQNAGDTFGETTPLKDYDYEKLEKWFWATSELDFQSEYVPSIAGFYYSASQNPQDNRYIVDYLYSFAQKNPEKNWRWFMTAAYLAKHKLNDDERAFNIAKNMLTLKTPEMAVSQRVWALFTIDKKDEKSCKVFWLVYDLLNNGDLEKILTDAVFSAKGGEYNYMFAMVKQRVEGIIKDPAMILKCKNKPREY